MLVLKGAVGGSVAVLALFGVTVPVLSQMFGIDANSFNEGIAAGAGAILGVIAALKA